jgi:hypothetical protein
MNRIEGFFDYRISLPLDNPAYPEIILIMFRKLNNPAYPESIFNYVQTVG